MAPIDGRGVDADALIQRLSRRGNEPLGLIDVHHPQALYENIVHWLARQLSLLSDLAGRYTVSDEDFPQPQDLVFGALSHFYTQRASFFTPSPSGEARGERLPPQPSAEVKGREGVGVRSTEEAPAGMTRGATPSLERRAQEPRPPDGRWRVRRTPMPLPPASGDTATSVSTTGPSPQVTASPGVLSLRERGGVRASPVRDPSPLMEGGGGREKNQGSPPHPDGHVEGVDTPKDESLYFRGNPLPPGERGFYKGVDSFSTPAEGTVRPVLDIVRRRTAPAFRGTAPPVLVPFVEANLTTAIERGGDPIKASASGLPLLRAGVVVRPEGSFRRTESNRVGQELPSRDGHPVSTLARVRSLDLAPPSPVLAGGGSVLAAVDTVTATGPTRPPLVFLKRSGTDAVVPSAGRREQDPRPVGSRREAAIVPAAMPLPGGRTEATGASQTLTVLPEAPRFGLDARHYEQLIEQLSRRIFFTLALALERRGVRRWP